MSWKSRHGGQEQGQGKSHSRLGITASSCGLRWSGATAIAPTKQAATHSRVGQPTPPFPGSHPPCARTAEHSCCSPHRWQRQSIRPLPTRLTRAPHVQLRSRRFDSEKSAGRVLAGAPLPQALEVGDIMNVMEQLDHQYTDASKPGIGSNFSYAGKQAGAASAVANCRLHPDRTIYKAADAGYRSVRDIHIQLGMVK
jgi:hypothetical protein